MASPLPLRLVLLRQTCICKSVPVVNLLRLNFASSFVQEKQGFNARRSEGYTTLRLLPRAGESDMD